MKNQKGLALIEVVLSIALAGLVAVGFLNALSIGSEVAFTADEIGTAKSLAENQMEYVKGQPFNIAYDVVAIAGEYDGYSVNTIVDSITARDGNIQKITVTIDRNSKEITRLEGYKTR